MKRRTFLKGSASVLAASIGHSVHATASPRDIRASSGTAQIAPSDYPQTELWAYNGQVPGATLRFRQGDWLEARLINDLQEDTTIHWHGLRLPNDMDGVPGMTQEAVAPGASFDYRFQMRDAGTYWYHPHQNSVEQISRGLAGVIIVDEDEQSDVDGEETLVLQDWRMTEEAQIHPSFGNRHDMSHAGRLGNYVTVNGQPEVKGSYPEGARVRLRLVNTATAKILRIALQGWRAWVVALDGMPLGAPYEAETVEIGPAQRVDLIADVTAVEGDEALIASVERGGTFVLATYAVTKGSTTRPAPAPLPPNDMPLVELAPARTVPLVMEGGAMRGLPSGAVWKGEKMDARALAEAGQFWAFNAVAGMTDAPLVEAALGETIRIPMQNKTAFPHAMHLHGMHFREVMQDGSLGPWRDTLVIHGDQTREIVFVAENPGDWMFHCHMASHQMSGMMNWIRVKAT
ncbi:multicopper oxidase family protein [Roseovarius phycicola]|uniref:Multicopper oxidase family protein n=1 Tax=Roseovarius phycicola TaxID=3080976 RepID=A0ABZ2HE66_9RHOB